MSTNRSAAVLGFNDEMRKRIIGQGHVIEPLSRVVTRGEMGVTDPRRPRGSFLFVGPTGVGKTETAIAMSETLGIPLARIDMSEFQLHESVGDLLGRGDLTGRFELVAEELSNGGILLLDEIEKAHSLVLDLLLQLLDAGRLTTARGKVLSWGHVYVILTSNIGAAKAMKARTLNTALFTEAILAKVRQTMRPEIYNRIGAKVVFRALEVEEQFQISELVVKAVLLRLKNHAGVTVRVSESGLRWIRERGIDREQGARPLRGVAEDAIEFAVALALAEGKAGSGLLEPTSDGRGLGFVSVAEYPTKDEG